VTLVVLGVATALLIVGCGGAGGGGGSGDSAPTAKIVSDLPLQGANRAQTTTMVNAIKLAIEQRDGKAGDVKIEYESLDDATAQAGQWDEAKCAENAQNAAQDEISSAGSDRSTLAARRSRSRSSMRRASA
jgi:branched-chain amino acid transport system substrate-binding protein